MKVIDNCNAVDYVLEKEGRTFLHVVNGKKVMGCDRAGGDWEIVPEMLKYFLPANLVICKL